MLPLASGLVPATNGGRPVLWAATCRAGGVSQAPYDSLNLATHVGDDPAAVAENHARVQRAMGARSGRLALMGAVHGREVAVVGGAGIVPGVDALVTQDRGLVLLAQGADCVPVALIGADGGAIAAVHCGWRGLVRGVLDAAMRTMEDLGAPVVEAVLGPSICGDCYPVPDERAAEVAGSCERTVSTAALVRCADGQPGIDVRAGLAAHLGERGVPTLLVGGCTAQDAGLFSYRRDGRTGRQGMAVMVADADADADADAFGVGVGVGASGGTLVP